VLLPRERLAEILRFCRRAGNRETGGILIGRYNESLDLAIVHQVSGPPRDSVSGRTWFHRGVEDLQKILLDRWRGARDYYLGEWHFHPGSPPVPSPDDEEQMKELASTAESLCPEPILLILGGNPRGEWSLSAHVYPRSGSPQEMAEIRPTISPDPVS
jgi:integrative and conjugative element protein (TIGR02256 family)